MRHQHTTRTVALVPVLLTAAAALFSLLQSR
jgi:hypothetical protein